MSSRVRLTPDQHRAAMRALLVIENRMTHLELHGTIDHCRSAVAEQVMWAVRLMRHVLGAATTSEVLQAKHDAPERIESMIEDIQLSAKQTDREELRRQLEQMETAA